MTVFLVRVCKLTLAISWLLLLAISSLVFYRLPMLNNPDDPICFVLFNSPKTDPRCATVRYPTALLSRSGSTFFGSLFNFDPRAFYIFEPLDALYSSLYGVAPGWTVPSDIVSHADGSERLIPDEDKTSIAQFLSDLMSCRTDQLPTEFLTHKFWKDWQMEINSTASYAKCVDENRLVRITFDSHIHRHCGWRFGQASSKSLSDCRRLLLDVFHRQSIVDKFVAERFNLYRKSMDITQRSIVNEKCIPLLKSTCDSHAIRVVKLVRSTMDSMHHLLRLNPDVRVIHLVRDPRAVALSRRDWYSSARGLYAEQAKARKSENMVREVSVYCRWAAADVLRRRRLEEEFPGRLYSLTYEQLTADPVGRASEIYRFIGEPIVPSVLDGFAKLGRGVGNRSSKWLADRWLDGKLTPSEFEQINERCAGLRQLFPEYSSAKPVSFKSEAKVTRFPQKL